MISRQHLTRTAAGLALMSLLLPALASAETDRLNLRPQKTSERASSTASKGDRANICKRLSDSIDRIEGLVGDRGGKLRERKDDKKNRLLELQNKFTNKLEDLRGKQDDHREKHYSKLEERAKTDAQKAAVAAFEVAVDAAAKVRRTAVDAANKKFQDDLKALLTSVQATIDSAVNTYKTATQTALDKAKTDCTTGIDAATIKSNLQASLKAAHDKFQSDRQSTEGLRGKVEVLRKARRAAIKAAIDTFKTVLDKAKTDLKATWGTGNSGNTTTTTP